MQGSLKRPLLVVMAIVLSFLTSGIPSLVAYAATDKNEKENNSAQNTPQSTPLKDWVCKYVGKPGEDERLKEGNDGLVWVNTSATEGTYFADAQGRSYVLKADAPHDPKPSTAGCPAPDVPTVQYMTVAWKVVDSDGNGNDWEQAMIGHVLTSTPDLSALDHLLVNTTCNRYQVDVYHYTTAGDKTKVDNLIAGGVLYGPNNPPEPLISGGPGVAYKLVGTKGTCPLTVTPCVELDSAVLTKEDLINELSDTRATGHYEVVAEGLHIWTEGATSTDKVAEYWNIDTPLQEIGTPSLDYSNSGGGLPGLQLVVDFDNDGTTDGILVGESVYGNDWWLSNGSKQFVKDNAPSHTGGFGSSNHGTLDQWLTNFPDAHVQFGGFSLGSGVKGDGVINSITIGCVTFAFDEEEEPVTAPVGTVSKNDICALVNDTFIIPESAGVSYYVDGDEIATPAGTYSTDGALSVTITAQAHEGYILTGYPEGGWTLTFTNESCGEIEGETDVCPNLFGSQTTVPVGSIKDQAGNCITPVGQTLGTQLPARIPSTGATESSASFLAIIFATVLTYGAVYFLQGKRELAK